jgi:uncharacterized membrane protein YfcA
LYFPAMEIIVIGLAAFLASLLTFFSGFGLGTVLLAVMSLFFPLEVAVVLTALVHFANNLMKMALIGRHASRSVLLKFGLPALLAALLGAFLLSYLGEAKPFYEYSLAGSTFYLEPLSLVIGLSLAFFALADSLPFWKRIQLRGRHWVAGGLLSGFFGGISGQQGALRSLFLVHGGLSKEGYIATGTAIAVLVDLARIPVYLKQGFLPVEGSYPALLTAVLAAFGGALLGKFLLKKMTLAFLHRFVLTLLVALGLSIAAGLL